MLAEATLTPHVTDCWSVTRGGGAVLAVVDANVSVDAHPAFIGRTIPGYRAPTPAEFTDPFIQAAIASQCQA